MPNDPALGSAMRATKDGHTEAIEKPMVIKSLAVATNPASAALLSAHNTRRPRGIVEVRFAVRPRGFDGFPKQERRLDAGHARFQLPPGVPPHPDPRQAC